MAMDKLTIPWKSKRGAVIHSSPAIPGVGSGQAKQLEAVLIAIAKARIWIEELTQNQTTISLIAKREGKGERYIRLLLPLAFTGPELAQTLLDRSGCKDITLSKLAANWPPSWKRQIQLTTRSLSSTRG